MKNLTTRAGVCTRSFEKNINVNILSVSTFPSTNSWHYANYQYPVPNYFFFLMNIEGYFQIVYISTWYRAIMDTNYLVYL